MTGFAEKVELGRTGLRVSRIGIGSSYGPSPRSCLRAFDAGVNYFFWGSVRTRGMGYALRELAQTHRDELVVVLESYTRGRWTLRRTGAGASPTPSKSEASAASVSPGPSSSSVPPCCSAIPLTSILVLVPTRVHMPPRMEA